MGNLFIYIILCPAILLSAFFDVKCGKIPNRITLPAVCAALTYYSLNAGMNGFIFSLSGTFVGILLFMAPYAIGAAGAGDAKLMGAVGAALGPKGVIVSAILSFIIGGLFAFLLLLFRKHDYGLALLSRLKSTSKALLLTGRWMPAPARAANYTDTAVPRLRYGVVIALGTTTYMALVSVGYHFLF